jgi:two-component system response regulator NreC
MDMTQALRVLVVDDHALVREGLQQLLGEEGGFDVVGVAADGRQAVELAKKSDPDVVLMDLAMPGLNGLDATRRVRKAVPNARVLALSMYIDNEYIAQALEAGVSGYIMKDASPEELFAAVRDVGEGRRHFSKRIPESVIRRLDSSRKRKKKGPRMTAREREVMKLLAEGNTVKQIAEILDLSQKTVDTHKTNMMKKLGIHNRVDLVKFAMQERLIQL